MKKLMLLCLLVTTGSFAQLKGNYKTGQPYFYIDTLNGMYNGKCVVWNKDGSKKLSGSYKNNQKSGKWVFYDTLGNKRAQVTYTDNYTIERIALRNSAGEPIRQLSNIAFLQQKYIDSITNDAERSMMLSSKHDSIAAVRRQRLKGAVPKQHFGYQLYKEERDSFGVIEYPFVCNRDIIGWVKMFRFAGLVQNEAIFKDKALQHCIANYLEGAFSPEVYLQSDFMKKMDGQEALVKIQEAEIVGYKIYEMWYFDANRLTGMPRILGICPVVFNSETKMYEDLFWMFYPRIREEMAAMTIKNNEAVENLEEVFHFRQFSSFVYYNDSAWMQMDGYMRPDRTTEAGEGDVKLFEDYRLLVQNAALLEITPLELEHWTWMWYTK